MKKLFAISLILSLITTADISVIASEAISMYIDNTYTNSQYDYIVDEFCDAQGRIFRSYTKEPTKVRSNYSTSTENELSLDETKSLLRDLGMKDTFVNSLSTTSLDMYSQAENIQSVVTYSKVDEDGNIILLDEATALNESISVNVADPNFPIDFGDGTSGSSYYNIFSDNYMVITLLVTKLSGGEYHYSVDAEWLTMPSIIHRHNDFLGVCINYSTVQNSTRSGWYSIDGYNMVTGPIHVKLDFPANDMVTYRLGQYYASGVFMQLPVDDINNGNYVTKYTNVKMHYEFKSTVNNASATFTMNATASYTHTLIQKNTLYPQTYEDSGYTYVGLDLSPVYVHNRTTEITGGITYTP